MRQELEAEARRRQLSNVVFRGRLDRAATIEAVQHARLLVHTSECYENFPMAIAEAFACGTPVLCSRLGAMREIVAEGETGVLFEPGDPADLAAKLTGMWNRPHSLAKLGSRARNEYQNKYMAHQNYARLMEIYAAVQGSLTNAAVERNSTDAVAVGGGQ